MAILTANETVAVFEFEYEGGVWRYESDNIETESHPYEGYDHLGNRTYSESGAYTFRIRPTHGEDFQLVANAGQGELRVEIISSGKVFQGKACVSEHNGVSDADGWRSELLAFQLKSDE